MALAAAAIAFASAAVTAFWTAGGTLGLDTVGGALEELARERSAGAVALGLAVVAAKVAAGLLALGLTRPGGSATRERLLTGLNGAAAVVLVLWGGANVVVGGLVLAGAITPAAEVDERALRWHVAFWDLWFVVWGVALAVAVALRRRAGRAGG